MVEIHGPHNPAQPKAHAFGNLQATDAKSARRDAQGEKTDAADHVSAPEIDGLLRQMRELANDRADKVAAAADRLAQGKLLTREAAERTAAVIAENTFGRLT